MEDQVNIVKTGLLVESWHHLALPLSLQNTWDAMHRNPFSESDVPSIISIHMTVTRPKYFNIYLIRLALVNGEQTNTILHFLTLPFRTIPTNPNDYFIYMSNINNVGASLQLNSATLVWNILLKITTSTATFRGKYLIPASIWLSAVGVLWPCGRPSWKICAPN